MNGDKALETAETIPVRSVREDPRFAVRPGATLRENAHVQDRA